MEISRTDGISVHLLQQDIYHLMDCQTLKQDANQRQHGSLNFAMIMHLGNARYLQMPPKSLVLNMLFKLLQLKNKLVVGFITK